MSGRDSFLPYPDTCVASADSKRAVCAQRTPRQNHILAALPLADYERLLPDLEFIALPRGRTVYHAGDRQKHLYFIVEGIVSTCHVSEDGASTESAVTGSEGVVGVALVLGGGSSPSETVVLSAGYAYRLKASLLDKEFAQAGPLSHLLLRYILALIRQTGQIAACNRHHSLKQRLCRCILSSLDRLRSNDLTMTQELIADMLGVRRESVSEAAGKLQKAGLIRCNRGHIVVPDRRRLDAHACECYAAVKREYNRLLPEIRQAEFAA